eukprot:6212350-Pleurochrysis_carterae.AAC.3
MVLCCTIGRFRRPTSTLFILTMTFECMRLGKAIYLFSKRSLLYERCHAHQIMESVSRAQACFAAGLHRKASFQFYLMVDSTR